MPVHPLHRDDPRPLDHYDPARDRPPVSRVSVPVRRVPVADDYVAGNRSAVNYDPGFDPLGLEGNSG
jgi:hypothetical protein